MPRVAQRLLEKRPRTFASTSSWSNEDFALAQSRSPDELSPAPKREVHRLRTVLHLRTPIQGKLREPSHVLELVGRFASDARGRRRPDGCGDRFHSLAMSPINAAGNKRAVRLVRRARGRALSWSHCAARGRGQTRRAVRRRGRRVRLECAQRICRNALEARRAAGSARSFRMTPTLLTEWSRLLLGNLARAGVEHVVVSPGSTFHAVRLGPRSTSRVCAVIRSGTNASRHSSRFGQARVSGRAQFALVHLGEPPPRTTILR